MTATQSTENTLPFAGYRIYKCNYSSWFLNKTQQDLMIQYYTQISGASSIGSGGK